MVDRGPLTVEGLYYSLLFGDGVYEWKGEVLTDPLSTIDDDTGSSPVLTSVFSGEEFYARRFGGRPLNLNRIRTQALQPLSSDVVLWPHDLISVTPAQHDPFDLFADNQYMEQPLPAADRPGETALLFSRAESNGTVRMHTILKRIDDLTWKNHEVRRLAVQTLHAFERLNRSGYGYHDINPARFLMHQDGSVMLDYTTLIYAFEDYRAPQAPQLCAPEMGEYPLEYAEPAYVHGVIDHLDFDSQNYSLAAFLFYLFFGRCAYDGKLLVGFSDDTVLQHYAKLRAYQDMPVFIFDDNDDRNALGLFGEDEALIELWNECPESIRELFTLVLCGDNALRRRQVANPPPRTWLRCFEELGWVDVAA